MKALMLSIRDKFLGIWAKIVAYFWAFVKFWRAFPHEFVTIFKEIGVGVANFFRELPQTVKSKDKVIDLLVGTAAVIVWCMPAFVVVFVLTWFLTK